MTRTERENRRCRRSIHQARRNRPAAWLVPNRFRSDDRDGNVLRVGDSFYCWTEEKLTRFHGIRLLEALKNKFGEELAVFLDRAGYFYARDLWKHVSGERETEAVGDSSVSCVRGDDPKVWYFPSKLPELNAVEGCWDQLQEWFKYRLMPRSLDAERLHSTRIERDHRTEYLVVPHR